ncbi:hypothetical protein GQ53DRAFT_806612, partial [Thozetella sp. PMI_491]
MPTEFRWIASSSGKNGHDEDTPQRRKTGMWGKQNMRQHAVFLYDVDQKARASTAVAQQHSMAPKPRIAHFLVHPGQPIPLDRFERLVVNVGVNVLDLDELTRISIGQRAATMLTQGRMGLERLIARRRESYLMHLPARFGHNSCLEDALRYLAIKARHLLGDTRQSAASNELALYGKALRSLQAAIEDDRAWADADVLCAVEVLSMCEVLSDPPRPMAWESHLAGACRLIRARGPTRFTTEFEKSLLSSMLGPIISECMRLGQPCFFEESAWQPVLRSVILSDQDFSPRCASYYELSTIGARIPRLFMEVRRAVLHQDSLADDEFESLEARCRLVKADLAGWRRGYEILSTKYQRSGLEPTRSAVMWHDTLCAGLVMQAMVCRLISALSWADRLVEEEEAVVHSRRLVNLHQDIVDSNDYASFYIEQKLMFVESVLVTSDLWLRAYRAENEVHGKVQGNRGVAGMISARTFRTWCDG